jgi:perosamine synthetase
MVTLQQAAVDARMRKLRWLGHTRPPGTPAAPGQMDYYHETEEIGFRHHMNDLSAAIGIVQLRKLERHNDRRRAIAAIYTQAFSELGWVTPPVLKDYAFTAQHKYVIQVGEEDRDALYLHLKSRGVGSHVHFVPTHMHPAYAAYSTPESLPATERFFRRILTLPLFPTLTDDEIAQVIEGVQTFPRHARAGNGHKVDAVTTRSQALRRE